MGQPFPMISTSDLILNKILFSFFMTYERRASPHWQDLDYLVLEISSRGLEISQCKCILKG